MRIAVTYDNGNVFQHFGRTENFKVYDVEDNKVVSSEVVSAGGAGHEALAGVLADFGVDVLLCGGLGDGAQNALSQAGIVVISGVSGSADEAVEAFLRDELESAGVNCDHHGEDHEEEEEGCGGGCGSSCGGGCGGCGGGCGAPQILYEGPNAGKNVRVHYRGTLNDGSQFDSSYERGETLNFICGAGMMIPGFDKAVVDMAVGDIVNVHLMPEEAYGEKNPNMMLTIKIAELPGSEDLEVGQQAYLQNQYGQPFPVRVTFKDDENITLDANHELAGEELNFQIELVEVMD